MSAHPGNRPPAKSNPRGLRPRGAIKFEDAGLSFLCAKKTDVFFGYNINTGADTQ